MLTLLIETSTERALIALMKVSDFSGDPGGNIVRQIELPFGFNNSKYLLPAAEELLQSANISTSDVEMIATGIGPGSYTGIRVGAIVAKSLAYALQIPLVGLCSLEGFIPEKNCKYAAMVDAKIGGAYFMIGEKGETGVQYISLPAVCSIENLYEHLKDVEIIVTPDSKFLRPKLQAVFPAASWEWEEKGPNAMQLMRRALTKFHNGEIAKETQLDLLYLRKTQAEIEKEAKK